MTEIAFHFNIPDRIAYLSRLLRKAVGRSDSIVVVAEGATPDGGETAVLEKGLDSFGHVRLGVGSQRLATRLMPPETGPLEDLEPVSTVALRRFVRTHAVVHALTTAVSLRSFPAISVDGVRQETRALARAMVMELCAFHGPDHLMVGIVCADAEAEAWSWAKWLPQVQHPTARTRAVGNPGMSRLEPCPVVSLRGNPTCHARPSGWYHTRRYSTSTDSRLVWSAQR